jgi:hypothetical protein
LSCHNAFNENTGVTAAQDLCPCSRTLPVTNRGNIDTPTTERFTGEATPDLGNWRNTRNHDSSRCSFLPRIPQEPDLNGTSPNASTGSFLPAMAAVCLLLSTPSTAQAQWRFEIWLGNAYSLGTPLTIHQEDEEPIRIDADWSTRPWRPTWYYSARVAKWKDDAAWAFEYMHHKLYLDNPSGDVFRFRITNGVNNLLVERHWRRGGFELGVGAGPSFAVPISNIRGKTYSHASGVFSSRYELAGGTLMGTLARRVKLFGTVYASFAAKTTVARLRVNVADGHADLTNVALHLQWGISLQSSP